MTRRKTVNLILDCRDVDECKVYFEPTGVVHVLRASDRFTVEVVGAGSGEIEISFVPEGLVVWPWLGGIITSIKNKQGDNLSL